VNPQGPSPNGLLQAAQSGVEVALGAAGSGSSAVKIFLLLTALSFATAIVLSVTAFTRVVIVLSFLRQALGTPQLPPNQVMIGLSLFLTLFIMAPTGTRVHEEALAPLLDDKITLAQAAGRAEGPVREFLLRHTQEEDLKLFFSVAGRDRPARGEAIPLTVLVPAFMVSELGTAFRMGLFIFIPLLLIDLLVAAVLMSLGMMMVPPQMVALPLKVGVFLLAGGWHLVVSSLVKSFS
jgi:flagellar biosynthetic protein FliP